MTFPIFFLLCICQLAAALECTHAMATYHRGAGHPLGGESALQEETPTLVNSDMMIHMALIPQ